MTPLLVLLLAYVPTVGSLLRRAAEQPDRVDRKGSVLLQGQLRVGDAAPTAAKLELRFPLKCKLQTPAPAAVLVRNGVVEQEGAGLGAARDLARLACPLLTFKGGKREAAEEALKAAVVAAGADLNATALERFADRAAWVIGANAREPHKPQLWFYKDEMAPARLVAREGQALYDLRLLHYGTPASGQAFPRVIELWQDGRLSARFESLEAGSRRAGGDADD